MKAVQTVHTLSRISGLSKEEIREIILEIKKNNKLLDSCSFHNFDIPLENGKYKCSNCSGIVEVIRKTWYEKGIAHAKECYYAVDSKEKNKAQI